MTILEIAKHTHPGQGAFVRSVWMAMEQLAYQQRHEHHGRAFVAPQNYLAKIADASIPTIKRVCALLEEIGLLTVTRRKTSACRRDFNHYTLKYPQTTVPTELWFHSSGRRHFKDLDIKGGTNLSPAAAAASPLALRDKFVPITKENESEAAEDQDTTAADQAARETADKEREAKFKAQQRVFLVDACKLSLAAASFDRWDPGNYLCDVRQKYTPDVLIDAIRGSGEVMVTKVKECEAAYVEHNEMRPEDVLPL